MYRLRSMNKFLTKFGLRFASTTDEAQFVEQFTLGDLGRTRYAMVLGAVVYSAFSVWDWILDPRAWIVTLAIRLSVAVLVLLPLAAVLFWRRAHRFAEPIYLAYCIVPGCALSLIFLQIENGFDHGSAGLIIVILFVSTLLPLRILSLATFCAVTLICFALCESLTASERPGLRFIAYFEIGIAYLLSLYAVGAREIQARRQFRTTLALQSEKERSEASLIELRETQVHLVQAEKLASLGQLVYGMAHEVSTPLGLALTTSTVLEGDLKRLIGNVEAREVRRSDLTQGTARLNQGIHLLLSNLRRATDLVHSFRQVATNEASEDRRQFELRSWIVELMTTLRPLLQRKGLEMKLTCADGIMIDTFPGALAQVMRTLALNAAVHGYSNNQTGVFELSVMELAESGRIRMAFTDDGAGIADENLPRVFDPFFTTTRDKGSAGLGLHIVFNLVVSTMGGRISVVSSPGMGARFIVDLPYQTDIKGKRIIDEAH